MRGGGLLHPEREMLLMPLPHSHPGSWQTWGKECFPRHGSFAFQSTHHCFHICRVGCDFSPTFTSLLRSGLSFEMLPRSISRNDQALR